MPITLTHGRRGKRRWPALVPRPVDTLEQFERFAHRDLEAVSADALGAERQLLRYELARRTFSRRHRPRILLVTADGCIIDDGTWLRDRLARVSGELRRRRVA